MNTADQFVSDTFLADRYSVHRVSIWRWVRENRFPAPIKLTAGCSRWRLSDVEAFEATAEGGA